MRSKLIHFVKPYFDGFLSVVYPEFCVICQKELNIQNKHFCFVCEQDLHFTHFEKYRDASPADEVFWGRVNIEKVYSMLYYSKGNSTQNLLFKIKYHEGKELGQYMGILMGQKVKEIPELATVDAIIPIPLHSKKEFVRGYNQSLVIAKGISEALGIPIVEAIYRKSHGESQTRKSKEERFENAKDRFDVRQNELIEYRHVVIVDDVLTTGSTLEFAARTIKQAGIDIKISMATIAMAHH